MTIPPLSFLTVCDGNFERSRDGQGIKAQSNVRGGVSVGPIDLQPGQ
jgi:hypothetical protein